MNQIKLNLYSLAKEIEIFIFYFFSLIIFYLWSLSTNYLGFEIGELDIHLGNITYISLIFLSIYLVKNKNIVKSLWIFFSTLALLDMTSLMYIKNQKHIPTNFLYNLPIISIILISLLITVLAKKINFKINKLAKKNILTIFTFSIIAMIIYHGSNYYLKVVKHVPNEDRSIFIGDLEFHHINYGLALLILLPLFYKIAQNVSSKISFLVYAFIGFIYGTVIDESYYYMLKNVTDEAYLYPRVILIQLIFVFMLFGFILMANTRKKDVETLKN